GGQRHLSDREHWRVYLGGERLRLGPGSIGTRAPGPGKSVVPGERSVRRELLATAPEFRVPNPEPRAPGAAAPYSEIDWLSACHAGGGGQVASRLPSSTRRRSRRSSCGATLCSSARAYSRS